MPDCGIGVPALAYAVGGVGIGVSGGRADRIVYTPNQTALTGPAHILYHQDGKPQAFRIW